MRDMYRIQREAKRIRKELKQIHVEAESDGVKVIVTAEQEIVAIDIPETASVQSVSGDGWACTSMGTGATCERQRLDKGVSPALAASIVPPRATPA